ncbi:MAG: hypothetical protein CXZ00_08130 [Acidobacteria bacterium]|nr:MAG: hypothetical protein CXZ00_08130 [Acidobacteriota bacterium]
MCLAAQAPSDGSSAGKKSTRHQVARPAKKDETAEKLRELTKMIEQLVTATQQSQQQNQEELRQTRQELRQTQQELRQTQQELRQAQQQLVRTQQTAQQPNVKIAAVEASAPPAQLDGDVQAQKIQADLAEIKSSLVATTATAQKAAKKVDELEHPSSISYKGVRITPGGVLEMTGYFRTHAMLSDQATPFSIIPLAGQANTKLTEFGQSARYSRINFRADSEAGTTRLTGYYDMDFLGVGTSANLNQTTGYSPRIRQVWGRAKFANGWTVTGGQMWNLVTLNRKGTDADSLFNPHIIEVQFSIGYDIGRFAELRVSKTLNKNFSLAFGLANPAYLSSGATAAVAGLASPGVGFLGNSQLNNCTLSTATPPVLTCTRSQLYSTNLAPDMIVKLAYDNPKWGHYELRGLSRLFRDRVVSTATVPGWNNIGWGGGIGAGAVIPLKPRKLDLFIQGLYGKGISRYQDAGQYDFVVRDTDHQMQMIESFSILAGLQAHPTPKLELDLVVGDEYYARTTYRDANGAIAGYGAPTVAGVTTTSTSPVNTGCYYETSALAVAAGVNPTCTGHNRNIWNARLYGYYDIYKGPMGTLRYGAEFDYLFRGTWSVNGLAPHGNMKTAFLTMQYLFP